MERTRIHTAHGPRLSAASVLVPVFLIAASPTAPQLEFSPEDGSAWTRIYEEETSWELEDAAMAMNGEQMTFDLPQIESVLQRKVRSSAAVEVEAGLVQREERAFELIEGRYSMDFELPSEGLAAEYEFELSSPLVGESVVFTRSEGGAEDGSAFEVSWPGESERDETLLAGLIWESDYQFLLPDEAVEEGDSWEVDAARAWTLLAPSGELHFLPSERVPGDDVVPVGALVGAGLLSMNEAAGEELDGELEVTLAAIEEEDGARIARLDLSLEGSLEMDRHGRFAAALEALDAPEGDKELEFGIDVEGEGVLLWDLERNMPRSMKLELDFGAESRMVWPEAVLGYETQFEATFEVSGVSALTYRLVD